MLSKLVLKFLDLKLKTTDSTKLQKLTISKISKFYTSLKFINIFLHVIVLSFTMICENFK